MNKCSPEPEYWRRIALQKQGMGKEPFGTGTDGVENAINFLGYIQIDTLNVIERAHHHTLWNRVEDYQSSDLDKLLAQRKIFEHWHHALSNLPIADYRFAIPFMQRIRSGDTPYYKNRDPKLMRSVLERIKCDGPLRLRDFKEETPSVAKKGAWNSRPIKRALEILFLQGDLMVSKREKMERVYDLPGNILPSHIPTKCPTEKEVANYLIETTLRANGFSTLKYILHGKSTASLKKQVQKILDLKVKSGEIDCYETGFMPLVYSQREIAEQISSFPLDRVRFLSPFDNAIINRERAEDLFDFSYRLECYTPAAKRKYGYFCLPILFGDRLVGRVDCKAERKNRVLNLLHIHFEKNIHDQEAFFSALASEVHKFAKFNQCQNVEIHRSSPEEYKGLLMDKLQTEIG